MMVLEYISRLANLLLHFAVVQHPFEQINARSSGVASLSCGWPIRFLYLPGAFNREHLTFAMSKYTQG
jgi:hypothetical protein